MNKISITIISLLLLIIALGAYQFIFKDSTVASTDGRLAIILNESEKDLILEEMRGFLSSTQQIIQAVADDDMSLAIKAAKKAGRVAQGEVPMSLVGKLPMAFKKLGFDTHTKFDELAMDAQDMEDKEQTIKLLAQLMQNCVACHAAYSLKVAK